MALSRPDREKLIIDTRSAMAVLVGVVVAGALTCKGPPTVLYAGQPRSIDQIAVLDTRDPSRARVRAIDEQWVSGAVFHLDPGRHDVWIRITVVRGEDLMTYTVRMWCGIAVEFREGATYEALVVNEKVRGSTRGSQVKIGAKIVHTETGEEFHPTHCGDKPDFAT